MSKKIFFIVLTCCLLVATFCVSFAGAPQVQHAPANVRAVLDRPDCLTAPLIVPPVVEPPLMDVVVPDGGFPAGTYILRFNQQFASQNSLTIYCYTGNLDAVIFDIVDTDYIPMIGFIGGTINVLSFDIDGSYEVECSMLLERSPSFSQSYTVTFLNSKDFYLIFNSSVPFYFTDGDDVPLDSLPFDSLQPYVAPPTGVQITGDIVDILFSGLTGIGQAVGEAFSTLAEAIFIAGSGLSTFGILVVVFSAISLGLSLVRWVLNFVTSWGNRNR